MSSYLVLPSRLVNHSLADKTQVIPPEIITEIFLLVCNERVFIPIPLHGYPWTLGHICSRWRQILWNSPSIWNTLTIGYRYPSVPINPAPRLFISNILEDILSKISGVISLFVLDGYIGRVTSTVFENMDRFHELSVHGISPEMLLSLFQLPAYSFVNLEELTLSSTIHERNLDFVASSLETAPKLRSVTLQIASQVYIPSFFKLPWSIMEHISVTTVPTPPLVIWSIFRTSPCLLSCYFNIDVKMDIPTTSNIIIPNLSMLDLETDDVFDWDSFFRPLVAPSLESLIITSPRVPCAMLASFIIRSNCALRELDLSEYDRKLHEVDKSDFGLLLDHLSSLTSLSLLQTLPPPIFFKINDGALLNLVKAEIFVHPDGFAAFLDVLDAYIVSPTRCFNYLHVVCFRGPGFSEQKNRYLARYGEYSTLSGLEVIILDGNSYSKIQPAIVG
ncbi:hypothetical protein BDZ94DRAFT_1272691 [Collybia nuda]|uniref:F-box domain-containing protein n=1 Tax=Collybia nuda TaxID=64659 RepID=A0A9P6C9W6_9AGAR|nr:hypothetical protein BDZ94DRAFT_1272691 [Collybia nuda]